MKSFLTALLLLSACASVPGNPKVTVYFERQGGGSKLHSTASQVEEDRGDYGDRESFSHSVTFDQGPRLVTGVSVTFSLGAPAAPAADPPPPWTPEEPEVVSEPPVASQEKPEPKEPESVGVIKALGVLLRTTGPYALTLVAIVLVVYFWRKKKKEE